MARQSGNDLGGIVDTQRTYFTLRYDNEYDGWTIDGGAVHGIAPVTDDDTTTLAIFPPDISSEQMHFLDMALGTARVTRVRPGVSNVEVALNDGEQLDPQQTYKAIIIATPMPRMGVVLEGDEEGISLVRDALAKSGSGQQPSPYVREVT